MYEVKNEWIYPLSDKKIKNKIDKLSKELGLSTIICTILYNRGFKTEKEIKKFIDSNLSDLFPPEGLKDIEKCADIVIKHLKNGKVVLYSDYDTDGFGCVIVFVKIMKILGYHVEYHTNSRKLGYGLKVEGVDDLMKKYPKTTLILTSDNGIVAYEGIDYAVKTLGLEVCVTDHHDVDPTGRLPECSAIVNPKRLDDTYPFKGLCGTAVIYKLCQIICTKLGKNRKICDSMLDIVGLATVGDVMPLLSENRVFVKESLKMVNKEDKKIWKFMRETLTDPMYDKSITATTYGFNYVPAINACSRLLGDMEIPITTFLLEDKLPSNEELIKNGILKMKSINEQRKDLSNFQTNVMFNLVEKYINDPMYVLWAESLEEGIVGIIAGRICEKLNKPVIVLTNSFEHPDIWKGSGRSIDGFDMKKSLDEIQKETNCLVGYGGHYGACGVTIETKNLEEFKKHSLLKAKTLLGDNNTKKTIIDIVKEDKEYDDNRLYDEICSLAPYGKEFSSPLFGIKNFNPDKIETFGGENKTKHLKLIGENITYTCWNSGEEWINDKKPSKNINAIGELGFNDFEKKLEIKSRDYNSITFK